MRRGSYIRCCRCRMPMLFIALFAVLVASQRQEEGGARAPRTTRFECDNLEDEPDESQNESELQPGDRVILTDGEGEYGNGAQCGWEISSASSGVLALRVDYIYMDIESCSFEERDCNCDWLEVAQSSLPQQSVGAEQQQQQRYCAEEGGVLPLSQIYTPTGTLSIRFRTDGSITYDGFEVHVTAVNSTRGVHNPSLSTQCRDGSLPVDIFVNSINSADIWLINDQCSSAGLSTESTRADAAAATIAAAAPILGERAPTSTLPTFRSMFCDQNRQDLTPVVLNIGGRLVLDDSENRIYDDDMDCGWLISGGLGVQALHVEFVSLGIEYCSNDCSCDSLKLSNASTSSPGHVNTYCGRDEPSPSNYSPEGLEIRFTTDGFGRGSGFVLHVTALPLYGPLVANAKSQKCEGRKNEMLLVGESVHFFSEPFVPYSNNEECSLRVRIPEGEKFEVIFLGFELEDSDEFGRCAYDALDVSLPFEEAEYEESYSDDDPALVASFCGETVPRPQVMNTNATELLFKFRSDNSIVRSGFSIRVAPYNSSASLVDQAAREAVALTRRSCLQSNLAALSTLANRVVLRADTGENACNWTIVVGDRAEVLQLDFASILPAEYEYEFGSSSMHEYEDSTLDSRCSQGVVLLRTSSGSTDESICAESAPVQTFVSVSPGDHVSVVYSPPSVATESTLEISVAALNVTEIGLEQSSCDAEGRSTVHNIQPGETVGFSFNEASLRGGGGDGEYEEGEYYGSDETSAFCAMEIRNADPGSSLLYFQVSFVRVRFAECATSGSLSIRGASGSSVFGLADYCSESGGIPLSPPSIIILGSTLTLEYIRDASREPTYGDFLVRVKAIKPTAPRKFACCLGPGLHELRSNGLQIFQISGGELARGLGPFALRGGATTTSFEVVEQTGHHGVFRDAVDRRDAATGTLCEVLSTIEHKLRSTTAGCSEGVANEHEDDGRRTARARRPSRGRPLFRRLDSRDCPVGVDGESCCEGHGYGANECAAIGCCEFDDGQCWSSVGRDLCSSASEYDCPSLAWTLLGSSTRRAGHFVAQRDETICSGAESSERLMFLPESVVSDYCCLSRQPIEGNSTLAFALEPPQNADILGRNRHGFRIFEASQRVFVAASSLASPDHDFYRVAVSCENVIIIDSTPNAGSIVHSFAYNPERADGNCVQRFVLSGSAASGVIEIVFERLDVVFDCNLEEYEREESDRVYSEYSQYSEYDEQLTYDDFATSSEGGDSVSDVCRCGHVSVASATNVVDNTELRLCGTSPVDLFVAVSCVRLLTYLQVSRSLGYWMCKLALSRLRPLRIGRSSFLPWRSSGPPVVLLRGGCSAVLLAVCRVSRSHLTIVIMSANPYVGRQRCDLRRSSIAAAPRSGGRIFPTEFVRPLCSRRWIWTQGATQAPC